MELQFKLRSNINTIIVRQGKLGWRVMWDKLETFPSEFDLRKYFPKTNIIRFLLPGTDKVLYIILKYRVFTF